MLKLIAEDVLCPSNLSFLRSSQRWIVPASKLATQDRVTIVLSIYINNKCDKPLSIWTPNTLSCFDDNERCQTLNPGLDVVFWQDLDFFQEAESIHTSETIYITHEEVTHTLTISTDVRFFDGEPIDVEESSGCNSAGRGNHLAGAFLMMAGIVLVGRLRRRASKEFVDNYQSPEVL